MRVWDWIKCSVWESCMSSSQEIVITGIGIVSPIGSDTETFYQSLLNLRSGVHESTFPGLSQEISWLIGGRIVDFRPEKVVKPRKNLKVMSRDIQLSVVASIPAMQSAGLATSDSPGRPAPERIGVVCGADLMAVNLQELAPAFYKCIETCENDDLQNIDLGWFNIMEEWGCKAFPEIFPLWMLKYLPNMHACHIAIAQDARGPNNSLTLGECSFAAVLDEASSVIRRNAADLMIAGSVGDYLHPNCILPRYSFPLSSRRPVETACRPFDRERAGAVLGEGAGMFVLERRDRAETRAAKILGTLVGVSNGFESRVDGLITGHGFHAVIRSLLAKTGVRPDEIAHVNASAMGLLEDDRAEARAIRETLGDVWVTAPKSFFGDLGAGAGSVELAVSLLALQRREVPPTLNYDTPDPECPVRVVGSTAIPEDRPYAISLNHTHAGNVTAILIRRD